MSMCIRSYMQKTRLKLAETELERNALRKAVPVVRRRIIFELLTAKPAVFSSENAQDLELLQPLSGRLQRELLQLQPSLKEGVQTLPVLITPQMHLGESVTFAMLATISEF